MATFTPPADTGIAAILPLNAKRWMQHFRGSITRGRNVWIVDNATAQDYSPVTTYNSDGSVATLANDRITRFFQGGTSQSVTTAEATILTSSGFGSGLT